MPRGPPEQAAQDITSALVGREYAVADHHRRAVDMVGYYVPENISNRDPFTDRVYLAPVGNTQINQYKEKGFTLTQTPGW